MRGAVGERIGRLKAADGSTLLLDEIDNLPLHLQPKLLTTLEQREVLPVGANKPIPIDVRVIATTNASPDQLADEKKFRQDLLFRLNTIEIELPPLRLGALFPRTAAKTFSCRSTGPPKVKAASASVSRSRSRSATALPSARSIHPRADPTSGS